MGKSGAEYLKSPAGIVRIVILVLGCIAFVLVAATLFRWLSTWIMAAYAIAWCFSLLSFFFIVTSLASQMNCGVEYEAVDVCITALSFFHCTMASIVLCINTPTWWDARIAACVFGFFLSIAYAVEGYLNQGNAPESLKYIWSKNGIVKSVICITGCTTFILLLMAGTSTCSITRGYGPARTWALAAYIIGWSVTVILLMMHVTGLGSKVPRFNMIEFLWSAFSFLLFLVASIVLSCYTHCGALGPKMPTNVFGPGGLGPNIGDSLPTNVFGPGGLGPNIGDSLPTNVFRPGGLGPNIGDSLPTNVFGPGGLGPNIGDSLPTNVFGPGGLGTKISDSLLTNVLGTGGFGANFGDMVPDNMTSFDSPDLLALGLPLAAGASAVSKVFDLSVAAAVFGFVTAVLYLIDSVLFKVGKQMATAPQPSDVEA